MSSSEEVRRAAAGPVPRAGAPARPRTTEPQVRVENPWRLAFRRFLRHRLAAIGLVIVVVLLGSALLAPLLAPRDPEQISILDKLTPPLRAGYLLGAD